MRAANSHSLASTAVLNPHWSHAQLHPVTPSHPCCFPRTSQYLATSDISKKKCKPRGVTPVRQRPVFCELSEGEFLHLCVFFARRPLRPLRQVFLVYQATKQCWRSFPRGQHTSKGGHCRERQYSYPDCVQEGKPNGLLRVLKRKMPQKAIKAEMNFPIWITFQRRRLSNSLYYLSRNPRKICFSF